LKHCTNSSSPAFGGEAALRAAAAVCAIFQFLEILFF
jgi:hypothetical protein